MNNIMNMNRWFTIIQYEKGIILDNHGESLVIKKSFSWDDFDFVRIFGDDEDLMENHPKKMWKIMGTHLSLNTLGISGDEGKIHGGNPWL